MVSAALVSILVGMAASNLGIIPYDAPAYSIVMEFLLPITLPLLLFRADMRQVMQSTGTLLLAFLLGSGHFCCVATFFVSLSFVLSCLSLVILVAILVEIPFLEICK